jgi:endo-1,4-beta-D-glucanase Y
MATASLTATGWSITNDAPKPSAGRLHLKLKRLLVAVALSGVLLAGCGSATNAASVWPEWDAFAKRFIQADGRVIDLTFDQKSTSEGQSYGLFFALVANDRPRFDAILNWTSNNLADGQLGQRLPAWLWGKKGDGSWGVKDGNAASDADLWLAYTLIEAARLWHAPEYAVRGHALLDQIKRQEVADAGIVGPVLLPGPVGFRLGDDRFRLDPSYWPGFLFRTLALEDPSGPWAAIWSSYLAMAGTLYASGIAPDLFIVDTHGRVTPDSERPPAGSYDAIRVYLWAGMSDADSAKLRPLLKRYATLVHQRGTPPERVDPGSGAILSGDFSPIGFSGAILPFLAAIGDRETLDQQQSRLHWSHLRAELGRGSNYYDDALILFGTGWLDQHYRFDQDGRLHPNWAK